MPRFLPLLLLLTTITGEVEVTTPVLQQVANTTHPAVATDGSDFLVVWKSLAGSHFWITAARITTDGTLLDPLGISLSAPTRNAAWMAPPEVHFAGARYLVTHPSHTAIDVIAVERDGRVAARRTIAPAGTGTQHRAATNGERMLLAWDDGNAAIVDRDLNIVAELHLGGPRLKAVASNGSDFLVFSGLQCAGVFCPMTMIAERFSSDGGLLSTSTVLDGNVIDDVAVTRVASRFVLFARFGGALVAYVLDDLGQPVGDAVTLVADAQRPRRMKATTDRTGNAVLVFEESGWSTMFRFDPATRTAMSRKLDGQPQAAIASGSSSNLLLTGDRDFTNASLSARFVSADLSDDSSRGSGIALSMAAPLQSEPIVGTNGKVFLVTWSETTGHSVVARGAIFDALGRRVGEPFEAIFAHTIASDGDDFLLAGSWGLETRVQRISAKGEILDPEPRILPAYRPAVVWNGTHYLMLSGGYETATGPTGHVDVLRLSRSGELIDKKPVSSRDNAQVLGVATFDGERTLAVWRDRTLQATHFDGAIVDRDGNVIAPLRLSLDTDSASHLSSLAYGNGEFLLTWWVTGPPREARATRISRDGNVLGTTVLDAPVVAPPLAVWNGRSFDVAWRRDDPVGDTDIFLRRGDGDPVIIDSLESENSVSLASIPNVATLIAYSRTINDHAHGSTTRVFVRVSPLSSGGRRRSVR